MDILNQHIDLFGKTRVINVDFKGNVISLIVYPCHPQSVSIQDELNSTKFQIAKKFIQHFKLTIISQYVVSNKTVAIIFKPENSFGLGFDFFKGMIIINPIDPIENINIEIGEYIDQNIEGRESISEIQKLHNISMLQHILERYTIFTYSTRNNLEKKDFQIIPDHVYNISRLGKRLYINGNNIMYDNGKLIVQSADIREKLLFYLDSCKLHYPVWVATYKNNTFIDDMYNSIEDFTNHDDQLVFTDNEMLQFWYEKRVVDTGNNVIKLSDFLLNETIFQKNREPFFLEIKSGIVMVQNSANEQTAKSILYSWYKNKINPGNKGIEIDKSIIDKIKLYIVNLSDKNLLITKNNYPILQYIDGTIGSILLME